jgi:nucleotide-binding universal stress UspA family protein
LVEGLPCGLAIAPHGYATERRGRMQRVGVAMDDSDEAKAALRTGIGLARRLGARLRVISVQVLPKIAYSAAPGVAMVDLERSEQQHAARILSEAMASVPRAMRADGVQPKGDPAACLEHASMDLDLLVMGSRGYGPLRRVLLGTVSATLLRSAHCPLLVVPRAAGGNPPGLAPAGSAESLLHA